MDVNVVIALLLIFGMGGCYYLYSKNKTLKAVAEESKDEILKDFLQIFIIIAKDCMDILTINKLNVTEDEYKELLAKKIVEVFNKDIPYDTALFTDDEKITFVKTYVLSTDDIIEKLQTIFSKQKIVEDRDTSDATEVLSSGEDGEPVNKTKNNMVDQINKYYEE